MSTDEIKNQLMVFHDPFSGATTQPKIPDGKTNSSLGFTTQAVREYKNAINADTMHMLLYAGQSAALIVHECTEQNEFFNPGNRNYHILGFTDSGGVDWSDVATLSPLGLGVDVEPLEKYALHRVVSCGMQVKALNPVETDDGWFECCRVNEQLICDAYKLTTRDNGSSPFTDGCVAPTEILTQLYANKNIVNDPTYATGLLRDLGRVQFELHGRLDYHDFRIMESNQDLAETVDVKAYLPLAVERQFQAGSDNAKNVINQYIDPSYDMIYLRLHCRGNSGEILEQGSRFHVNVVSNQEIYYSTGERDNRYMTHSHTIGAGALSVHAQARRANRSSITLI